MILALDRPLKAGSAIGPIVHGEPLARRFRLPPVTDNLDVLQLVAGTGTRRAGG
jgi:hypothetical protein